MTGIAGRPRAPHDQLGGLRRRSAGPARRLPRVALATCRDLPGGEEDAELLLAAAAAAGLDAEWRVWDDAAVEWASYDLVVVRSTYDYVPRRDDFTVWAASVPRLANPAGVLAWNTDKTYLRELAAAGVPVVPTWWLEPDGAGVEAGWPPGDWPAADGVVPDAVVKPAVSTGGQDTTRYAPADAERARAHAGRLLAAGRPVLVQPYLAAVDEVGETAVVFLGGAYSHAVGKAAVLRPGADASMPGLWRPQTVVSRQPSPAERALAEQALAAVPGGARALLYARVDLLPGPDGTPLVTEVELTEPSLFLDTPGAADRFAAAIRAAVAR